MPLITHDEAIEILQLSSNTDYDQLIKSMIPIVRDFIVDYTHNRFLSDHYIYAGTIAFVNAAPATITDSDSNFVESYLTYADDIHVGNSLYNDGYYAVASVAAGTITLANGETLNTEAAAEASPIIHEVKWPKGLKRIAARMIGYELQKNTDKGIASESIGGYSVSYSSTAAYPESIMSGLNIYRQMWD